MQASRFSYVLHWTRDADHFSPNHVIATRAGEDPRVKGQRQFAIDFTGPKLASLPDGFTPEIDVSCTTNGAITDAQAFQLPTNGVWRAMIKMQPKPGNQEPVNLRCALKRGDEVLTETWTYLWSPR